MASCSVFFASLFFVNSEISDAIKMVAIAIIIAFNVSFYAVWVLGLSEQSKNKYVAYVNQLLKRFLRPLLKYTISD